MDKVIVYLSLSREELLAQLAEECSEAAQAALKLRRAGSGENPTPVSEEDAFHNRRGCHNSCKNDPTKCGLCKAPDLEGTEEKK